MGCLRRGRQGFAAAGVDRRGAGRARPQRRRADLLARRPVLPGPGATIPPTGACPSARRRMTGCHDTRLPRHQRTRIKICGLTREADVDAAVDAGADAIGFVLYPKSPRYVTLAARGRAGARACRPFVTPVLLFVNAAADRDRAQPLALVSGAAAPIPRRRDAGRSAARLPAAPYLRAARIPDDRRLRFARLRVRLRQAPRPPARRPRRRLTAAAERYSIGHSSSKRQLSRSFCLVGCMPANVTDGILQVRPPARPLT